VSSQINADSLYNVALTMGKNGEYNNAIEICKNLLKLYPDRYDIMVFLSNVYGWKGDYEKALSYIEESYRINHYNEELYDTWLNLLLWSKDYKKLIDIIDLAKQNNYSNNYNMLYKKLLAYKYLGETDKAIKLVDENKQYLDSTKIKSIYNELVMNNRKQSLNIFYGIDFFDNNSNIYHLSYLDYCIKAGNNKIIPRINYTNKFKDYDFQTEVDYYRIMKGGDYLYVNYGVGIMNNFFPIHRGGLEYYFSLGKGYEYSLGGRYLYFNNNRNIYIATTYLGKYVKNYLFSVRPFYVIDKVKNSFTGLLNIRYYGTNPVEYWSFHFIYGNSPDERYVLSQNSDVYLLKSYRLKVERNISINRSIETKLAVSYSNEEFVEKKYRNRYGFEMLLKYNF